LIFPEGEQVVLPGRGKTWIRECGRVGAPPLVLLHGLGATGLLNWFPSFDALARTHRVITIDHRGHGRGIRPRLRFRLEDCADDVAAAIEHLGLGPAVLAGYSMGGPITQLTWKRHPEVVAGVVLCATSYRFGPSDMRMGPVGDAIGLGLRFTPRLVRQQMMRGAISRFGRVPDWAADELNRHDSAAVVEATMAIRRFDSSSWIGDIDVPAASVVTTYDRLVPPRRQLRLAELTRAEVFESRGGHDVCVMRPERFVPHLVEAVRSVSQRV
jgi:3-oxoadipate enol-lactonase